MNDFSTPAFEITVKTLVGKSIAVESVRATTLVTDLKVMVEEKDGIPADQQRITFAGRQLEDHRTVGEYNIVAGSVLHVVHRMRGCKHSLKYNWSGPAVMLSSYIGAIAQMMQRPSLVEFVHFVHLHTDPSF
jgi:hypothetical protein